MLSDFEIVKEFVEVPRDFFLFDQIGRWYRHSNGSVMRTFLFSNTGLRCTQHATLVCESGNLHGYCFFWTTLVSCWLLSTVEVPTTSFKEYVWKVHPVAGAVRSQVFIFAGYHPN